MSIDLATILPLEHRVWQALIDGNAQADADLLADDYLGVYATGYGDRAEHVAQLDDGPTVSGYRIEQARVTELSGGLALLTYLAHYRRVAASAPDESMWVSSIWRREGDGRWLNIFSQDTAQSDARPV